MNGSFQAECARLQAGVVLEKCRHYLLTHTPSDKNWQWCAEYVSKYGEPATPTTLNAHVQHSQKPMEALSLSARRRAVMELIASDGKN